MNLRRLFQRKARSQTKTSPEAASIPPAQNIFSPANTNIMSGIPLEQPSDSRGSEATLLLSHPNPRSSRPDSSTPTKEGRPGLSRQSGALSSPDISSHLGNRSKPSKPSSDDWSSAVGRATLSGKSGQEIERLNRQNMMLQKENECLRSRLDEELQKGDSTKTLVETLEIEKENLTLIFDSNKIALERKDRKIEELKAVVKSEQEQRKKAVQHQEEVARERDEFVVERNKELFKAREQAQKSSSQYEVLSSSFRSLDGRYRRQIAKLVEDVQILQQSREADNVRLNELSVISTHLSHENHTVSKAYRDVVEQFEVYKKENEDSLQDIKQRSEISVLANDEALQEVRTVMGHMKHVINVKRDVKDVE